MTTQPEPEPTLRATIVNSGWILDHPWLGQIARSASTPTAADLHVVRTLGLPTSAGRQMRDLVRARFSFPAAWSSVSQSACRPADALCVFGDEVGPVGNTVLQVARQFGDHSVDIQDVPLLLKDFRLAGSKWNSLDENGDRLPDRMEMSGARWQRFPIPWPKKIAISLSRGRWELSTDGTTIPAFPDIVIKLSHAFSVLDNKIPIFWKAIGLKRVVRNSDPHAFERLRLIVREDLTTSRQVVGHMMYQYVMLLGHGDRGYETATVTGDFSILRSGNDWHAYFMPIHHPDMNFAPAIRLGAEEVGIAGIRTCTMAEAMAAGTPVLEELTQITEGVDLNRVIGQSLFTRPPGRLLDLLI